MNKNLNHSKYGDITMANHPTINPLTRMDYPDPDVIRVGDTYYLVSTTMYFFPGCEILRSHDLVNWEHCAYVYDRLDSTDAQRLAGKENAYGQGMWAASLRYHNGRFYVVFVANDTHKTYLYTADSVTGPWKKSEIKGFYHDNSILFDDDGRVYIVYGNREIYLTELDENLTGPKEGGLNRLVVKDIDENYLGYEGSHIYKINGKYYIFFIHILKSTGRRTESCFVADSLEGEFVGKDVFDDDNGYHNSGIAQGGIVDTPSGKWYSILFQDSGAVGRIPYLIPVEFRDVFPVYGVSETSKNTVSTIGAYLPEDFEIEDLKPGYSYDPLYGSDDFKESENKASFGFKSFWQFNHEPELSLIEHDTEEGFLKITTGKISSNLVQAQNTLTQRTLMPCCSGEVTLDGSSLNDGDYAGLSLLQSSYGFIGLKKESGRLYIVMCSREINVPGIWGERKDDEAPNELASIALDEVSPGASSIRLRADVDFTDMKDTVRFSYAAVGSDTFTALGPGKKLYFKLDHFTGARFGLFAYSTKTFGGAAKFMNFQYN
ncbi:glycoside hydrolase family 43 protein [Butyrivibrio sp. AE3009]|uniref:glycoside hydrolase family 43 protein n=1 Tax=Butyrivibrio sp. AE3009 TaxID=1280666 RepID=UPI001FA72C5C|nr:glycoside hydrolase 43 family protein [Butyrivibrio sp. AE3009]